MWGIQLREDARFALEARAAAGLVGQVPAQHLDCHRTVEPRIPGAIDLAHPASAKGGLNLVRPELVPFCRVNEMQVET